MNIRTRIEYLLAKIAGHTEEDISDLTPPVATDATEALLIEIAERIDTIEEGVETPAVATGTKAGVVKMAANVPALTTTPAKEDVNAIISALINAGIMAPPAGE